MLFTIRHNTDEPSTTYDHNVDAFLDPGLFPLGGRWACDVEFSTFGPARIAWHVLSFDLLSVPPSNRLNLTSRSKAVRLSLYASVSTSSSRNVESHVARDCAVSTSDFSVFTASQTPPPRPDESNADAYPQTDLNDHL